MKISINLSNYGSSQKLPYKKWVKGKVLKVQFSVHFYYHCTKASNTHSVAVKSDYDTNTEEILIIKSTKVLNKM